MRNTDLRKADLRKTDRLKVDLQEAGRPKADRRKSDPPTSRPKGPAKKPRSGARGGIAADAGQRRGARAVLLIGFMGAGKSSVGLALGEKLGWKFEDLDRRIELRERRSVADIFRESGESRFRQAEHDALKDLLRELQLGPERVIALGGGTFAQRENISLIEASGVATVLLDANVAELWRRCRQQGNERPLLGTWQIFRQLYKARRPHYLRARVRQQTTGKTVEQIAADVVQALGLDQKREAQGGK